MTALTRKVDPLTGDRSLAASTRTWEEPASPELALVQNVLRTPKGSAGRDPSYGVEPVDNAAPNAAAVWRQNVLAALKRWIDRGVLRDVTVEAEVVDAPTGAELRYRVTFYGRSRAGRQTFTGNA
jgi:phage baseplate assembly protein W